MDEAVGSVAHLDDNTKTAATGPGRVPDSIRTRFGSGRVRIGAVIALALAAGLLVWLLTRGGSHKAQTGLLPNQVLPQIPAGTQVGPVTLPHPEADSARDGELKRLYVRATHQGQGLGRLLMDMALAEMGDRYGQAPQWIGVWSENHKAQALYAACGFVRVGAYQFAVGETMDDEFILRRQP